MVTLFYLIVFIASIVMTGFFMVRNRKIDVVFAVFGIAVTCNAMGRYMLATSTSVEMALFATKALYLGGCFSPLIFLVTLSRLCKVRVWRFLKYTMLVYSSILYSIILTIEKHDLYYKSVKLVQGDGYNYLIKEYGPYHKLYAIMVGIYCILIVYYLIYAIRMRTSISYKIVIFMCVISFVIFASYLLERLLGTNISYLSVGYLIAVICMGRFFDRVNMYDMTSNIVYSIERMGEYGYIAFDKKNRYVGSNDYAKELFPEIKEWQIDDKIKKTDSFLQKEVIDYVLSLDKKDKSSKTIEINNKYYELICRDMYYRKNHIIGYILEFVDRTAENRYIKAMKDYNNMLEEEVANKMTDLMHVKDMLILGIADLLESRDNNTGGHIKRTSEVIKIFSTKLLEHKDEFNISQYFLKSLTKAAPMHDLGKIAIDDKVLRKTGKYTEEEFNEMKKHTTEGARIVKQILKNVEDAEFYQMTKNIAHYHHEKWNGKGYPKGLVGEKIPIEARIMALADVFDALVSKRCYKEAFSYDKAFAIIEDSMGEHFDPRLGKIFLECRSELEKLYDKYKEKETLVESEIL